MKKLFKVLGIAAAIAMVLGFASCSDDSYDEAVVAENLNPSTDALWSFEHIPYKNFQLSSEGDIEGAIAADGNIKGDGPAKGATLSVSGRGYYQGYKAETALDADKTSKNEEILFGRVQGKKNSITLANVSNSGLKFTLHLAAKSSTVTIKASAAGSTELTSRFIAVTKKDDTAVIAALSADGTTLANSAARSKATTLVADLAAGDYTIHNNAANIFYISAKSQSFEAETVNLINEAIPDSLGEAVNDAYTGKDAAEIAKYLGTRTFTVDNDKKVTAVTTVDMIAETVVSQDNTASSTVTIGKAKFGTAEKPAVIIKSKKAGVNNVVLSSAVEDGVFTVAKFTVEVDGEGKITVTNKTVTPFAKLTYDMANLTVTNDKDKATKPNTSGAATVMLDGISFVLVDDAKKTTKITTVTKKTELYNISIGTDDADKTKITGISMGTDVITVSDGTNSQDITVTVAGDGTMTFAPAAAKYVKAQTAKVYFDALVEGPDESRITKITKITSTFGRVATYVSEVDADDGVYTIEEDDVAKVVDEKRTPQKGITFTSIQPGTLTLTIKGEFHNSLLAVGSQEVEATVKVTVTVGADGAIKTNVSPYYAWPFFYENDKELGEGKGKVTNIYSMKITEAVAKENLKDDKVTAFGKGIVTLTNNAKQSTASTGNEAKSFIIGEKTIKCEYYLETGGGADSSNNNIKLNNLTVGDYICVGFTSGGDAERGVYIAKSAGKVSASCEKTSTSGDDFVYLIHKVTDADLTSGTAYLNYSASVYIYALEIYKEK